MSTLVRLGKPQGFTRRAGRFVLGKRCVGVSAQTASAAIRTGNKQQKVDGWINGRLFSF